MGTIFGASAKSQPEVSVPPRRRLAVPAYAITHVYPRAETYRSDSTNLFGVGVGLLLIQLFHCSKFAHPLCFDFMVIDKSSVNVLNESALGILFNLGMH